jgi:Domain of unknown function (DUF4352)
MRRLFVPVAALCLLLLGSINVSAQEATPVAGGSTTIVGTDGAEAATITVTDFVDPFEDYDPNYVPLLGYHFVMASITVENSGQQPFAISPTDLQLIDTDGFTYYITQLARTDQTGIADFQGQNGMSPGDKVSGAIFFQVLNGATLQSLAYISQGNRVATIVSFTGVTSAPIGQPNTIVGFDLAPWAEVTVSDLQDPFQAYPQGYDPERGQHYVMINVTLTNIGERPFAIDPYAFYLIDQEGFAYTPVNLAFAEDSPLKNLEYTDSVEPGASISGVIVFQVVNGIDVSQIVFIGRGDRLVTIASAGSAAPAGTPEATPVP